MTIDQQILQRRAARKRRQRYWLPLDVLALVAFIASLWLPAKSPVNALIVVAYAIVSAAGPLVLDGADPWQRHRFLRGFAIGAAASATWMVVETIRTAVDSAHKGDSVTALLLLGLAWAMCTIFDRWRRDREPAAEHDA